MTSCPEGARRRAPHRGGSPRRLRERFPARAPLAALACLALVLSARRAAAAPEAHILRIDPRASSVDGAPILTTVLEIVQNKRMSELTGKCAALVGDANLDCVANALDVNGALYSSFDFPEKNAYLTITVDGTDQPARFESKARWGDSVSQPGVGTAWLILVDAAASMGNRFDEAKAVATAFINAMGPNDIVDVMLFNDKSAVADSKWVNNKASALALLNGVAHPYPSAGGRSRPLFNIIKQSATDGFKELGNAGQSVTVPMHQAMVVLSNGSGGTDPSSNAAAANVLKDYFTKGRFPENNEVLPKTPVPVISIWFPSRSQEEFNANAREFMEGLTNNEIGGYFNVVRDGHAARAPNIVNTVRTRFNRMHIVKWRVSCVAPSITQTFKLVFQTQPPIAGDATFQNVPVGIDPTTWPLDIDREATERLAKKDPIYPGGTVKIIGNFCWGGNAQYAELYMVPKNQQAPATIQGSNVEEARKAQKTLIEAGMRGKASTANDSEVVFEIPNTTKFLAGKSDSQTARLIVYDNRSRRSSAITADKILTLKAREAPLPYLLIGGITFGGVVLVLLLVSVFRGGGGGGRRGAPAAPPKPVVAGGAPPYNPTGGMAPGGFGGTPGGFGGASGAGGFGGAPGPGLAGGGTEFMYGAGPMPGTAMRASISGPAGVFPVNPGMEMRVGRDGSTCQVLLTEPRVSGTHASLKFEGGQLLVRDENSNNGTFLNGQRLPPGIWTPVPAGGSLRFGPVEFSARLE